VHVCACAAQGFSTIGLCRANNSIPQSVPAFYFEVAIEHGGVGGGCGVSVGYYRDGLPLEGVPGHNSIAYGGDTGALYRTVDGDIAVEVCVCACVCLSACV
jgi:hypothetical protein